MSQKVEGSGTEKMSGGSDEGGSDEDGPVGSPEWGVSVKRNGDTAVGSLGDEESVGPDSPKVNDVAPGPEPLEPSPFCVESPVAPTPAICPEVASPMLKELKP
jgi:hypothetical protein